jgi:hypothetical protein
MTADQTFQTLKSFFETRNAARQALSSLKEGIEIGVVIGGSVECALFRRGENPVVEARPANKPDVIFQIRPESVYVLSQNTKDEIGDVGVAVLKEVLAGNIKIQIPGGIMNLISRGYLDIVRKGGAPVAAFLARHGLSSVSKIINAIKRMRA